MLRVILFLQGVLLILLGSWRMVDPEGFFANSELILSPEAGLLSEARGTGGVVLLFGLLIFLGSILKALRFTAALASICLFFGFACGRLLGWNFDGDPGSPIIQGMIMEFLMALLTLFALYREENKNSNKK